MLSFLTKRSASKLVAIVFCLTCLASFAETHATRWHRAVYLQDAQEDFDGAATEWKKLLSEPDIPAAMHVAATWRLADCLIKSDRPEMAADLVSTFLSELDVHPDRLAPLLVEPIQEVPIELAAMQARLAHIRIPQIGWHEVPIHQAIGNLRQAILQADPAGNGINLIVRKPRSPSSTMPTVSLQLRDIPAGELIRYLCEASGWHFKVESHAVLLAPPEVALEPLAIRRYPVMSSRSQWEDPDLYTLMAADAKRRMEQYGLTFPDGANIYRYNHEYIVVNTASAHAKLKAFEYKGYQVLLSVRHDEKVYQLGCISGGTVQLEDASFSVNVVPTLSLEGALDLEIRLEMGSQSVNTRVIAAAGEPLAFILGQSSVIVEWQVVPFGQVPAAEPLAGGMNARAALLLRRARWYSELAGSTRESIRIYKELLADEDLRLQERIMVMRRLSECYFRRGGIAKALGTLNTVSTLIREEPTVVGDALSKWRLEVASQDVSPTRSKLDHLVLDKVEVEKQPLVDVLRELLHRSGDVNLILRASSEDSSPPISLNMAEVTLGAAIHEACLQADCVLVRR